MTDVATTTRIVDGRTVVSLKARPDAADAVAERLALSAPLKMTAADDASFWLSPGCWLLLSDSKSADELIERCTAAVGDILHVAVDYTAALTIVEVKGPQAREVLASGCALDLRDSQYAVGTACRTRFAQVAAFVVAIGDDTFELYVDASYRAYIVDWLEDSAAIAARCRSVAASST